MRKHPRLLLSAILLITTFVACKRDMETLQTEKEIQLTSNISAQAYSSSSGCVEDQDNGTGYDTILRPTVLGARLVGAPYSVANMQQASRNLYGTTSGITENKWCVRFKPADPRQLSILDSLNLDLFDYPLDYEVTQEGDYYNDGVTPAETIPWLYTVVPVNFMPPAGIQYELLQRMHVPTLASLEREAFRITGNPVPDTTCGGMVNSIGKEDVINSEPPGGCPPGTIWDPIARECVPEQTGPPQPSPTRQPSGTVVVFDENDNTNPAGFNVPVRNVRVIAKNFLKVERVFTNNQGQYTITKEFNRANIFIRTKNDQASIRSLRRARLWQMLFPVEVHFGKFKGSLRGLTHVIGRNTDARSDGAREWAAASAHNKVQEYHDLAAQQGIGVPPRGLKVLITNWRNTGGSAPMFAKRFWQTMPTDFVTAFVIANASAVAGGITALALVLKYEVDVTIGYNTHTTANPDRTKGSDRLTEVVYHELTHAAHYNKVGNSWWSTLFNAELQEIAANIGNGRSPYGDGSNTMTAPIIALAESWGEHIGHFLADQRYAPNRSSIFEQGITYQNGRLIDGGTPVTIALNTHTNFLEDFSPRRTGADVFAWIPKGLFYDLMDDRNDNIQLPVRVAVNDDVRNYTNRQMFEALDNDIFNLPNYRARLLSENANSQSVGVTRIFGFYGY